jgi:hypothetical protein
MGFSDQERINLNSKVLAAGVIDANDVAQWYESKFENEFISDGSKIWTQMTLLRSYPASTLTQARSNAAAIPTVIQDLSQYTSAIRLTLVPGSNNSTLVALSTYNNFSSARLDGWIQPQMIFADSSGDPSIGYAIRLFSGNPEFGGVEIPTTAGLTGAGNLASVGWIFNYACGLLFLSDDFRGSIADLTQLYVCGFRYTGLTAQAESAIVFDNATDQVNIRSNRAANQSDINNTKAGITNFSNKTDIATGIGVDGNYASNLGGDSTSIAGDYTVNIGGSFNSIGFLDNISTSGSVVGGIGNNLINTSQCFAMGAGNTVFNSSNSFSFGLGNFASTYISPSSGPEFFSSILSGSSNMIGLGGFCQQVALNVHVSGDVQISVSGNTASFLSSNIVGKKIFISGSAISANNGYFPISAVDTINGYIFYINSSEVLEVGAGYTCCVNDEGIELNSCNIFGGTNNNIYFTSTLGSGSIYDINIVCGQGNTIHSDGYTYSYGCYILSGENNTIHNSSVSCVVGGIGCSITGDNYSVILNGSNNTITGNGEGSGYNFIGAGSYNTINLSTGSLTANVLIGGSENQMYYVSFSGILSGYANEISIAYYDLQTLINPGSVNLNYSVVCGGQGNNITGAENSAIGGGSGNTAYGLLSAGYSGSLSGDFTQPSSMTVSGGTSNAIYSSSGSSISGGNTNIISVSANSIIANGSNNYIGYPVSANTSISVSSGTVTFTSSFVPENPSVLLHSSIVVTFSENGNSPQNAGSFVITKIVSTYPTLVLQYHNASAVNDTVNIYFTGTVVSSYSNSILGGSNNAIYSGDGYSLPMYQSTILGGHANIIDYGSYDCLIGNSESSKISNCIQSAILLGTGNSIGSAFTSLGTGDLILFGNTCSISALSLNYSLQPFYYYGPYKGSTHCSIVNGIDSCIAGGNDNLISGSNSVIYSFGNASASNTVLGNNNAVWGTGSKALGMNNIAGANFAGADGYYASALQHGQKARAVGAITSSNVAGSAQRSEMILQGRGTAGGSISLTVPSVSGMFPNVYGFRIDKNKTYDINSRVFITDVSGNTQRFVTDLLVWGDGYGDGYINYAYQYDVNGNSAIPWNIEYSIMTNNVINSGSGALLGYVSGTGVVTNLAGSLASITSLDYQNTSGTYLNPNLPSGNSLVVSGGAHFTNNSTFTTSSYSPILIVYTNSAAVVGDSVSWRYVSTNMGSNSNFPVWGLSGMSPSSIGRRLHLTGSANSANNGVFDIIGFISDKAVIVSNPNGVVLLSETIAWQELETELQISVPANGTLERRAMATLDYREISLV